MNTNFNNMNPNFMNMNTNINNMNPNFMNMNTNFNNMNTNSNNTRLTINDFVIIKRLGEGYFGAVDKVKYKKNGQIYALKSYEKAKAKRGQEIDYYREKAILYDLTRRGYPTIVKLYGDFEDNIKRYLVMECVEGINLSKKRDNNNRYLSQKEIINILTQLLQTLKFLHNECHIVHRDIKPDNIIMQNNGQIKLLDFGISVYLQNSNRYLVSNKSFKGQKNYVAPEILLFPPPLTYNYKIDIFSLGFTMYSIMNPTKYEDEVYLPKITEKVQGSFSRRDLYRKNEVYDAWLIDFIGWLYLDDQTKRPTAEQALNYLLQSNPKVSNIFKANKDNIDNMNNQFRRQDYSNVINNIHNFNTSVPNQLSSSAQQINNFPNTAIPIQRMNSLNIPTLNRVEPLFLNNDMSKENRVISSMKSLLQVLSHLDGMSFIQAQIESFFVDKKSDYSQYFIYSYHQMLNNVHPKDCNPIQINQVYYTQIVNDFIRKVFINNRSGISGTRPIILFYMITSIIRENILQYFNTYQNNILDYIIQSNFMLLNNIIPITANQRLYTSVSDLIWTFKNNYKGPLVDNFYFFTLSVSRCPNCKNFFGSRIQVAQFLQLDVPNLQNNIADLIKNYFSTKRKNGNYSCQNCKSQGQALRNLYCLNLPNYLILELEDKDSVNFNSDIILSLFNGVTCSYKFQAGIYKLKMNNITDFVAVFKVQENYFFYSDDKIVPCNPGYINLQCPSLVIYKKFK